jgi:Domain of unknown function (DUF1834)
MLAEIEAALVARLQNHPAAAHLVRTVGALPQVPSTELLQRYAVDAPAVYVVPGVFEVEDNELTPKIVIACIAKAADSNAARVGDGLSVGVDQLMLFVARAINMQRIGACSWQLKRGAMVDEDIFFSSGLTVLEMSFEGSAIELPYDYADPADGASGSGGTTAGSNTLQTGAGTTDDLPDLLHVHGDIANKPNTAIDVVLPPTA